MNFHSVQTSPDTSREACHRISLPLLLTRIVTDCDKPALDELLTRRPCFQYRLSPALLLPEYLYALCNTRRNGSTHTLDLAYDLTLDKFTHLPMVTARSLSEHKPREEGADCRYYYRAFLREACGRCSERTEVTRVGEEYRVAGLLQRFVLRHFRLSCLEAQRRSNPTISRYTWRLNGGGSITVWLPKSLSGHARRKWLEEHIDNPNPSRPGERERIQTEIDVRLGHALLVPLEWVEHNLTGGRRYQESDRLISSLDDPAPSSLAEFVAMEKALAVDLQRPSIRNLGASQLKKLVLAVFDRLLTNQCSAEELAQSFGLSNAAYSRFAGTHWDRNADGAPVPDLWRNTSQVLSQHPIFMEVARQTGVFDRACVLAGGTLNTRMRQTNYE